MSSLESSPGPSTLVANGITIHYRFSGPRTIAAAAATDLVVLINGLADDLETWSQQLPALHDASYRILTYNNRGVGRSSRPPGPYSATLLAEDLHALLHALVDQGEIEHGRGFHLLGVSMGGMVAQRFALMYPNRTSGKGGGGRGLRMLSLSLCCTYAQPTRFCQRMFTLWADMARRMSVEDVMRDVTLWAFTVAFFRTRKAELEEVETAMRDLNMGREEYLAQLAVIQDFDVVDALLHLKREGKVLGGLEKGQVLVLAGEEDILIPVVLSRELAEGIEGSRWATTRGGHGCLWEFPDEFNRTILDFLEEHRSGKVDAA